MKAVKSLPARPAVPLPFPSYGAPRAGGASAGKGAASLAAPQVGQIIGERYRLEEWLERGGMGSVWRAQQIRLRSPAAIKFLDPALIEVPEMLERFLQEARSAAAVQSAHVIQVFDFGSEGGLPYIAMELLAGENLDTRLGLRGTLTPAELDKIFSEVARGLGQAHELGVIHRDVKPGNIFLAREGRHEVTKLIDFGIAKVKADALRVSQIVGTELGTLLGTPQYMSPEQMRGRTTLDYRTDLWSLAIIACECLTGRQPFTGTTMGDLTVQICTEEPLVPSTLGDVPAGFDQWFFKGTRKEPSERFESAAEMADALSTVLMPHSRRAGSRGARKPGGARSSPLLALPSTGDLRRAWSAASSGILRRSAWTVDRALALGSSSASLLRTQARRAAHSIRLAGAQRLWARPAAVGMALLVVACGFLLWRPQPAGAPLPSGSANALAQQAHAVRPTAAAPSAPPTAPPTDMAQPKPVVAIAEPAQRAPLPVLSPEDLPLLQEPAAPATAARAPAAKSEAKTTSDRRRGKAQSPPAGADDSATTPASPMSNAMVRLGALLAKGADSEPRRPARAAEPASDRTRRRADPKPE